MKDSFYPIEIKLARRTSNTSAQILIDDEDAYILDKHSWHLNHGYLTNGSMIALHRMIMKPPKGMVVDHINGNRLDNRKSNLRVTDYSINSLNTTKSRGKTQYRGVHKLKHRNLFSARIQVKGKRICLGFYKTAEEASRAYITKQKELIA